MRAIVLALLALVLTSSALAYDPVVDTRKIMAGTVTTQKIKNEYLSGARDGTTVFKGALAAYKAVREAEPPPVPPTPTPTPTPIARDFVIEGDSLSPDATWSWVGHFKAAHPGMTLQSFAVGGSTLTTAEGRIGSVLAVKPVRFFIAGFGTNDWRPGTLTVAQNFDPNAWVNRLITYLGRVRAETGAKTVFVIPLPQCPSKGTVYANYNIVRAKVLPVLIAREAEIGTLVRTDLEAAFDTPEEMCTNPPADNDGMHWSGSTHRRVAVMVGEAIDKASAPVPVPTPTPLPVTGLSGLPPIASDFDLAAHLTTAPIPASAGPSDPDGAFRFICQPAQLLYDDPIVYPGQPGKSHLHQFYGNTGANAGSTYETLRAAGDSTCMNPLNRSAYWMPAMLDGIGNVVRPDYIAIYYKRRPKGDPKCSLTSGDPKAEGNCVELPNGLRFIFGWDMLTAKPPTGSLYFICDGVKFGNLELAAASGKCIAGKRMGAIIKAPACWNGKDLDTPNHRDHVAYAGYGSTGVYRCPTTHPYVIPGFTLQAWFLIAPGDDLSKWRLSSDDMHPDMPHGSTFHADFFMAWDPTVKKLWHDHCIDGWLNCADGDLGSGQILKRWAGFTYTANPRLVPIPPRT